MKNILIINGHPDKESYNYALSAAYLKGAKNSTDNINVLNLAELDFNPNLQYGYRKRTELEPDLLKGLDLIKAADHLVWVFPMWWYGSPAIMKGFIDRLFLPGIAFDYVKGKALPKKLFKGKSARAIITADTPKWYDVLFMKRPTINQFKKGTLQFCGINPVKVTYIAPIRNSKETFRAKWLKKAEQLGRKLK